MAKVLVDFEVESGSLKAAMREVQAGTEQISESTKKAGQDASNAFRQAGEAAKAAFASQEVKKALDAQVKDVDQLKNAIKLLYDEEVKLTKLGAQQSQAYKKNLEDAAKLRVELEKLSKTNIQVANNTDKIAKASVSLKTQLKNLKAELSALEQQGLDNTKAFQQIALEAAKLEDQIGDTNERVRVLASDTFKFDAAIGAVQGLAGAFSLAQGAVAVFGSESEDINKIIAKTQGALAILNGLQEISAIVTGQGAAKIAFQNIFMKERVVVTTAAATATGVLTTAEEGAAVATVGVARSLNVLKLAIASTGIGLLVIALVALYKAWEENQQATINAKKAFDDMAESTRELKRDTAALNQELITANENLLVSQGKLSKAEAERRQATREAYNEGFKELSDKVLQYNQFLLRERELTKATTQRQQELGKAQELYDKQSNQRNLSFLNIAKGRLTEALKDEKKAADARIALQNEINNNAQKRRELLNVQIKQINLDEQKDNKKNAKERVDIEEEVNKKIREIHLETLKIDQKANEDFLNQLTSQEGLTTLEQTLLNFDETTNSKLLTQRATFLKKEEAIGQGGLQNRINIINTERDAKIAAIREELGFTNDANNQVAIIEAEATNLVREEYKKRVDIVFEYANQIANVFTSLNQLSQQFTENRVAAIQEANKTELDAINNSLDTERNKQRQRSALELRTNRLIAQEKNKQSKQDKALAIFNIGLNTAESIVKTGSQLGYPAAIPFQIIAGVIGAAQLAAAASKPLPKFEKGGVVGGKRHSSGGTLIEAEKDEFIIRRDQAMKHRPILESLNQSTEAFRRHIDKMYIRPALLNYNLVKRTQPTSVNVNASLNSASMEATLNSMHRTMKKQAKQQSHIDSRYSWHRN